MAENLRHSGLFDDVIPGYSVDQMTGKFQFNVTAEVANPYRQPRGLEDFVENPLAVRLYGERARSSASAGGGSRLVSDGTSRGMQEPPPEGAMELRTPDRGNGAAIPGRRTTGRQGPRENAPPVRIPSNVQPPANLPEPLTEEQINAMSEEEARAAYARVARAVYQSGLPEEESQRLKREFELLRLRMRALREGGAGGQSGGAGDSTGPGGGDQ
jgi:hypothetical protein